jgi:hypothetical protein
MTVHHHANTHQDQLKSELGLSNVLDYTERMGTFGSDPFNRNPANMLKT